MIDRTTEMVGEIRLKRFTHIGRHSEMKCEDCGKTQYENITHIVTERPALRGGFIPCAETWLCEKCRSHRGRRDWVAPVSEGSPELTAARQLREEAVSSSSANTGREARYSVASKAWLEDLFLKGEDYGTARNTVENHDSRCHVSA